MIDRERRNAGFKMRKRAQRHRAAGSGQHINVIQLRRIALKFRQRFQDDVILVQLREERGNLPLAERVVERVVNRLRRDAEPRRRHAVNHQGRLRAVRLLVGGHVAELRQRLHFRDELRRPLVQFVGIRVFERVLILRAAHAVFHRQILHRLHVQRDAFDLRQFRLQAPDHVARADFSFFERLEVDENASAVECRVDAVRTDE